jgi:hypothetical protein
MDRLANAQAALVAELIGDLAILVQRAESFETTMEKAREAMTAAAWLLESRLEPFKHQLAAEMEQTKGIAIKAFIRQTNAVAELEQRRQTEAMAEAARAVVEKEVALPLRKFAAALKTLIERAKRPWEGWLTHATTAVTAAVASGWFVLHFFGR